MNKLITEFVSKLGNFSNNEYDNIDYIEAGRKCFYANKDLIKLSEKISSNINREPLFIGSLLGSIKGNHFLPSFSLLENIESERTVQVNSKAEWLFLCGRDIIFDSVISTGVKEGLALITNSDEEILGYGSINDPKQNRKYKNKGIFVKNILDRGDFLRREMTRTRTN